VQRDVTAQLDRVELLERRARTDPLTGLGNRRLLLLELGANAAARQSKPLGVLMIDIDRFKAVNDSHGHAVGDEVLAEVARRIASVVRGHDVVARWGARSSALPDVESDEEVVEVAERIRTAVSGSPIATADGEIAVTVSVGAVRTRPGVEPPELIDSADRALYVAKDAGRNRVELNDGPHRSDFAV
jgi:diguanylate cyclase (GGDEF)-like protein